MNDPYAGTGGTSGTLDASNDGWNAVSGGTKGGASAPYADASWLGIAEEYYEGALAAYAKSDVSASVDSTLASAKKQADKITESANAWLGFAGNPENITNVLRMATIIVVVLGVVYVVAVFAPVIGAAFK